MAEIGLEKSQYEQKPLRVFPIRWRPIDELQPHEDVNSKELEALMDSLRDMGLFFKPLLVDEDSGTVLDGTHRWAGLRELGASTAPTINLDYPENDEIQVHTWYPVTNSPVNKTMDRLAGLGISFREVSTPESVDSLKGPHLIGSGKCYRFEGSSLELFSRLEEEFCFSYTDDPVPPENGSLFYRQPPKRTEVIELAQSGQSVPAKSTRHWLPYKYQHIMVPLEEMLDD